MRVSLRMYRLSSTTRMPRFSISFSACFDDMLARLAPFPKTS
jgi:hypothetical protein